MKAAPWLAAELLSRVPDEGSSIRAFLLLLCIYLFFAPLQSPSVQTSTRRLARRVRGEDETVPLLGCTCRWRRATSAASADLKGAHVLYYYIFGKPTSTPKPTNSRSHRITFIIKIIPHILLEDKCSPENMITWAPFGVQTKLWHQSDKIDCTNNYPDRSPKRHQTL